MAKIRAEVVYALPEMHRAVSVTLEHGATLRDAIEASGLEAGKGKVGVFGKVRSLESRLADGDRVEIYRPLAIDPKESRRRRARARR